VPGGPEIIGVLVSLVSLLVHATNEINATRTHKKSDLFVKVILYSRTLTSFLGEWFTGHTILTLNPTAEVN
jgi:hypothetical protein